MALIRPEIEAIEASLKPVAAFINEHGFMDKSFAQCSRDEILALFACVIKTFRSEFEKALGEDIPF